MPKTISIYDLIQAMTATEKAYFKKYAFKKDIKSNTDFKRLFDILDKQKEFSLKQIQADKKLVSGFKKNIHSNITSLNHRVVSSILEYRKGKADVSHFFQAFEEYEMFVDKGLNVLAEKKIKKLEQFVIEKDLFYLKPFFYYNMNKMLLNNISVNTDYKSIQYKKYENSIENIYNKGQLNILSSKFEQLVNKNQSFIFTKKENLLELEKIKNAKQELLLKLNDDFGSFSSLSNNLMLISMTKNSIVDLKKTANTFLEFYKLNGCNASDFQKSKAIIFFKNISYYLLVLDGKSFYKSVEKLLIQECTIIKDPYILKELHLNILILKCLFYYLCPNEKIEEKDIGLFKNHIFKIDQSKPFFMELLTATSLILVRNQRFQESLDLTNIVFSKKLNLRTYDNLISLRIVRIVALLKSEEIDLFISEMVSLYRYLIKTESVTYVKHFVNFFKKFSKSVDKDSKKKLLEKLLADLTKIQEERSLFEKMEAIELKLILEMAL